MFPKKPKQAGHVSHKWTVTKRIEKDEARPHGSHPKRPSDYPKEHPDAPAPSRFQPANKGEEHQPHKFMGKPPINAAAHKSAGKKHKPLPKKEQRDMVTPDILAEAAPDQTERDFDVRGVQ
jgi:hypothetical protein